MKNNPSHLQWLKTAEYFSQFSDDPITKMGCVIINEQNKMISYGWNHFICKVLFEQIKLNPDDKYYYMIHAEIDAISNCQVPLDNSSLYLYDVIMKPPTCTECTKLIIKNNIKRIFIPKKELKYIKPIWENQTEANINMYRLANIEYIEIDEYGKLNKIM